MSENRHFVEEKKRIIKEGFLNGIDLYRAMTAGIIRQNLQWPSISRLFQLVFVPGFPRVLSVSFCSFFRPCPLDFDRSHITAGKNTKNKTPVAKPYVCLQLRIDIPNTTSNGRKDSPNAYPRAATAIDFPLLMEKYLAIVVTAIWLVKP